MISETCARRGSGAPLANLPSMRHDARSEMVSASAQAHALPCHRSSASRSSSASKIAANSTNNNSSSLGTWLLACDGASHRHASAHLAHTAEPAPWTPDAATLSDALDDDIHMATTLDLLAAADPLDRDAPLLDTTAAAAPARSLLADTRQPLFPESPCSVALVASELVDPAVQSMTRRNNNSHVHHDTTDLMPLGFPPMAFDTETKWLAVAYLHSRIDSISSSGSGSVPSDCSVVSDDSQSSAIRIKNERRARSPPRDYPLLSSTRWHTLATLGEYFERDANATANANANATADDGDGDDDLDSKAGKERLRRRQRQYEQKYREKRQVRPAFGLKWSLDQSTAMGSTNCAYVCVSRVVIAMAAPVQAHAAGLARARSALAPALAAARAGG